MPPKSRTGSGTKKSLADKIQTRKGDTAGWSKGPANLRFRKSDSVVFSLRLTVDELEDIRDRARQQGIGVSELVRSTLFPSPVRLQNGGVALIFPGFPSVQFGPVQTGTTARARIPGMSQTSAV